MPRQAERLAPPDAARSALPTGDSAPSAPPPAAPRPALPEAQASPALAPPAGPRTDRGLGAKLSIEDLARVRQALALLADEPAPAAGPTADSPSEPVPASGQQPAPDGDDADTFPLPVVLPGAQPSEDVVQTSRGPFEPARPTQQDVVAEQQAEPEPAESLPPAAAAKLDQIKDLLLTAEAIGEHNLDRHFEQVSQRQRELIREFFDEAQPGRDGAD